MPQTLLALLALSLVMMLSLHQQRQSIFLQSARIESDVDRAVAQVANDQLDALVALPFDNATRNGKVSTAPGLSRIPVLPVPLNERFTALGRRQSLHLPLEGTGLNDLDDADGRNFEMTHHLPDGSLRLRVEVVVGYVSEADSETYSLLATRLKKATVRVTPLGVDDVAPAILSRLYSCGSPCDW